MGIGGWGFFGPSWGLWKAPRLRSFLGQIMTFPDPPCQLGQFCLFYAYNTTTCSIRTSYNYKQKNAIFLCRIFGFWFVFLLEYIVLVRYWKMNIFCCKIDFQHILTLQTPTSFKVSSTTIFF